jgi:hypothetical protein
MIHAATPHDMDEIVNKMKPYPLIDIFKATSSDPAIPEIVPSHLIYCKKFIEGLLLSLVMIYPAFHLGSFKKDYFIVTFYNYDDN